MKSRAHFRSYRFPTSAEDNVPLSCTLINDGRHVVCGTTSGKAVVLDAATLAHQADLPHCGKRYLNPFPEYALNERDRIRPCPRYSESLHQAASNPAQREIQACCSVNGANLLATTASEKGAETSIKIWTADVIPGQSIGRSQIHPTWFVISRKRQGYADRITVSGPDHHTCRGC